MQTMFIIVPVIMIVGSIVSVLSPRTMWYLSEGWKYKNVEPSDTALVMMRIGGVLGVIFGIIFIAISQSMFQGMPAGLP